MQNIREFLDEYIGLRGVPAGRVSWNPDAHSRMEFPIHFGAASLALMCSAYTQFRGTEHEDAAFEQAKGWWNRAATAINEHAEFELKTCAWCLLEWNGVLATFLDKWEKGKLGAIHASASEDVISAMALLALELGLAFQEHTGYSPEEIAEAWDDVVGRHYPESRREDRS